MIIILGFLSLAARDLADDCNIPFAFFLSPLSYLSSPLLIYNAVYFVWALQCHTVAAANPSYCEVKFSIPSLVVDKHTHFFLSDRFKTGFKKIKNVSEFNQALNTPANENKSGDLSDFDDLCQSGWHCQ